MPTVETTLLINAPVERVYAIARDNRTFPEFMDDVKSLTVVEEDGDRIVSDYEGVVPTFGLKVRWRQEDVWDPATFTCVFRQLKGDYDHLDGVWTLVPEGAGTRFNSVLNYEYVVPGLGPLVKKVIHGIVVKNMSGIIGAIGRRAEG